MEENAIEITHLTKKYKIFLRPVDRIKESLSPFHKRYSTDFYALEDISLSIRKGETIGIIGKNGAGKSTLLKIITGVLTPTDGKVDVHGRIASLLELGAGFNPEMTGIENIYLNGTIMGISRGEMEDRLEDIVNFADIGDFIYQPVKTYSSGMFARLAFAVNAFVEPDILIVDEALSVGDLEFQSKCYRKFKQLKKKGITILLVTHDANAILNYCERAVLMDKGHIVTVGVPKKVVDTYKKRLAAKTITKKSGEKKKTTVEKNATNDQKDLHALWKESLTLNKNFLEYGDGAAEILDFAILNHEGEITSIINNEEAAEIKFLLKINREISKPIFAFSIKDLKGIEVLGTNTMLMETEIGTCNPGEVMTVTFRTCLPLHAGQYQLSLGCTEYVATNLCAHHRLYDVAFLEIVADRATCGIVNVQPEIEIDEGRVS